MINEGKTQTIALFNLLSNYFMQFKGGHCSKASTEADLPLVNCDELTFENPALILFEPIENGVLTKHGEK